MKNLKNAKTELEQRLEEEMRRDSEAAQPETRLEPEGSNGGEEVVAAEIADAESAESAPLSPIEKLQHELEQARDQNLRLRAEFDNYRKRMARESDRQRKRAAESVIMDLLPIVDNLRLAMQHADDTSGGLYQGIEMVSKQLVDALDQHGMKAIPAVGQPFDPRVHEAVTQVASDEYPRDTVAQEFQRGFMLGDQVLRPSRVAVSTGSSGKAE